MKPQTLYNTNLFVDGVSFAGDVPSLTLPKLTLKTEEYRGGGMDGGVDREFGLERMEASFSTNGVRREVLRLFGLADGEGFNGVFRGAYRDQSGRTTRVVATLRGLLKEIDGGEWKPGSLAEFKYSVGVSYYRFEIDGRVMYEIDPIGCVRVIDGVDQLADVRAALGM